MNPPNTKRNKRLVKLRKLGVYWPELELIFGRDKKTLWDIYERDKDKY